MHPLSTHETGMPASPSAGIPVYILFFTDECSLEGTPSCSLSCISAVFWGFSQSLLPGMSNRQSPLVWEASPQACSRPPRPSRRLQRQALPPRHLAHIIRDVGARQHEGPAGRRRPPQRRCAPPRWRRLGSAPCPCACLNRHGCCRVRKPQHACLGFRSAVTAIPCGCSTCTPALSVTINVLGADSCLYHQCWSATKATGEQPPASCLEAEGILSLDPGVHCPGQRLHHLAGNALVQQPKRLSHLRPHVRDGNPQMARSSLKQDAALVPAWKACSTTSGHTPSSASAHAWWSVQRALLLTSHEEGMPCRAAAPVSGAYHLRLGACAAAVPN